MNTSINYATFVDQMLHSDDEFEPYGNNLTNESYSLFAIDLKPEQTSSSHHHKRGNKLKDSL